MATRASIRAYWPLSLAVPLLLGHAALFNFVTDDAFISFVYARNLARYRQLVFNLGERVEGYTNFLWTVLLAGFLRLGLAPEIVSRVLGALFAVGTLVLVARITRRQSREDAANQPAWLPVVAPLLLAASGAFACWTSGGLETQMFACFVTAGCALYLEGRTVSALAFALAALTRPEGNLIFALVALHRLLFVRDLRAMARWAALYLALYLPYYAWRYHYYGWPFPNTFYIKSSGTQGTTVRGLVYLEHFLLDYGFWFVAPLFIPPPRARRKLWSLALVVCGGFFAYVAVVGGDFMGLYRFLVPVLPLLACTAQGALESLPVRRGAKHALAAAFLAVLFVWSARVSLRAHSLVRDDPPGSGIDMPAYLRKFASDRALIGKWFAPLLRPDDVMSVGGSGAQVYYADVTAIDAFGLNDAFVAHEVPSRGNRPGHQKWAPDSYIIGRRHATILCHWYKITSTPYVPPLPEAQSWRAQGYRWVSVPIAGLDPPYYNFLLRRDRTLGPFAAEEPSAP